MVSGQYTLTGNGIMIGRLSNERIKRIIIVRINHTGVLRGFFNAATSQDLFSSSSGSGWCIFSLVYRTRHQLDQLEAYLNYFIPVGSVWPGRYCKSIARYSAVLSPPDLAPSYRRSILHSINMKIPFLAHKHGLCLVLKFWFFRGFLSKFVFNF